MANAVRPATMTALEFLAWEREQPQLHEYVDGVIYAMAGGSPRHNALEARLSAVFAQALRGDCAPLSSTQRIGVRATGAYYYADASVVCGELETAPEARDVMANPSVLVEVLSRSTEAFDRGDKWRDYQQLGSLRDYLLVSQRAVLVEHFQRAEGAWLYTTHSAGARVTLADGAVLEVDEIYAGVMRFPSDE